MIRLRYQRDGEGHKATYIHVQCVWCIRYYVALWCRGRQVLRWKKTLPRGWGDSQILYIWIHETLLRKISCFHNAAKKCSTELRRRVPAKTSYCPSLAPHCALNFDLITLKKMESVPQERNWEDFVQSRRKHAEWFVVNVESMIYVDGSGFNL